MDLLSKLAQVYGTDKFGVHNYTPFYHDLFCARRDSVRNVLEIGIGAATGCIEHGASLRMWQGYFPNARIWGFDINPAAMISEGNIRTVVVDQRDNSSLSAGMAKMKTCNNDPCEIIIDDASHEPEDQVFCANVLIPLLPNGGVYIIEDVRQGNKERVQAAINYPTRVVEFDVENQTDDRLIICER